MSPNNLSPGSQLADQPLSQAKNKFDSNKKDIDCLLEIHEKMDEMDGRDPDRPGRRPEQVQVLHRAAIVMIIACWQAYVQDRFREVFQYLLDRSGNDPHKMPHDMKSYACRKIEENKNKIFIWNFSGDGWKTMLEEYAEEKLDKFSSPSAENR